MSFFGTGGGGGGFFGTGSPSLTGSFRGAKNDFHDVTNPNINFVNQSVGVPGEYDLPINQGGTYLGVPWYHFRSDWDDPGGGSHPNLISTNGIAANHGQYVKQWTNANFANTVFVNHHLIHGDPGWMQTPADQYPYNPGLDIYSFFPKCEERMIQGVLHKGLRFGGVFPTAAILNENSYLQTEGFSEMLNFWGANISDWHFNTGGAGAMQSQYANTGATFIFVLEPDVLNYAHPSACTNLQEHGPHARRQLLLYNRVPGTTAEQLPPPGCCTGQSDPAGIRDNLHNWPTMDEYGVQWWWQGNQWQINIPPFANCSYITGCPQFEAGPSVNNAEDPAHGYSVPINGTRKRSFMAEADVCGVGGSEGDTFDEGAYLANGMQIVMLEYDNTEHIRAEVPALGSVGTAADPAIRSGPTMRIYSLGGTSVNSPNAKSGQVLETCENPWPWQAGEAQPLPPYVVNPRTESVIPAMPNHSLLKDGAMFVGGAPPHHATETWAGLWSQGGWGCESGIFGWSMCPDFAHSFRGVIWEFIAYNAKLTLEDRRDLFAILATKFGI